MVGALVGDRDADDMGTLGSRRDLHVVGRPITTVAHLHDPSLRVAGRGSGRLVVPRLLAPLLTVGFLAPIFDLGMRLMRLLEPPQTILRHRLPTRLGAPFGRAGIVFDLGPQLLDRFLRRRIQFRQSLAAAERTAARRGTHPKPVDCHGLHIDQARRDQPDHRARQRRTVTLAQQRRRIALHIMRAKQPPAPSMSCQASRIYPGRPTAPRPLGRIEGAFA